jgi:hypothetical protein
MTTHLNTVHRFPNGQPLGYALAYARCGLSVVPIRRDGTKAAACSWERYQRESADEAQIRDWYEQENPPGIAAVCGSVSGSLECIDFDNEADAIFPAFRELVEAFAPGLIARLTIIKTPRPAYHIWLRCPDVDIPGSTKLATDPGKPPTQQSLIETKGEGGYALVPGCPAECHETGRLYEHVGGPALEEMQPIGIEERELLHRCAASFDRRPAAEEPRPPSSARTASSSTSSPTSASPGDDFEKRGPDWDAILAPHGWTVAWQRGEATYWRRPGKAKGWSATTGICTSTAGRQLFFVFSSSAAPFESGKGYSKFAAWTLLNHQGDFTASARALADAGYGERAQPIGRIRLEGANSTGAVSQPPPAIVRRKMSELERLPDAEKWLWKGLIPAQAVTILSALPKAGKTTLMAHLMKTLREGDEFCGREVLPARVLAITEEGETTWAERRDRVGLTDHIELVLRPFRTKPTFKQWDEFLKALTGSIQDSPVDLVVIDTLAKLWPVERENDASEVTAALMPLLEVSYSLKKTVVLIHHLRKSEGLEGTQTRGSGSLTAAVDCILEMRRYDAINRADCRRVLNCDSRYGDACSELVIELGMGGYLAYGDREEESAKDLIETIADMLPGEPPGMHAEDIEKKKNWPGQKSPRHQRLLDALRMGTDAGRWRREGDGKKGSPFTYWRPQTVSVPEKTGTETDQKTATQTPENDSVPVPPLGPGTGNRIVTAESEHTPTIRFPDRESVPGTESGSEQRRLFDAGDQGNGPYK